MAYDPALAKAIEEARDLKRLAGSEREHTLALIDDRYRILNEIDQLRDDSYRALHRQKKIP